MLTIDISQTQEIYSISRLNREVRLTLEANFLLLWVEGEISNFACPTSGHWYFSLKDASAQVRCAMFKPHNKKTNFHPRDGMHVLVKARVSLYEGRGEFQLIAEHMEEIGEGQLRLAFEALKKQLQENGLFDPRYKKSLPNIPKSIGIITSPTGAAIKDILSVLSRRFPCVPVIIYPTLVQGDFAATQIVDAIDVANRRAECDVLILARGGGSLEDLWPFNEEKVAQAIFKSSIPIVSGVGHEVDFTIADFVADVRAPTPSAAAELVTPDKEEFLESLFAYQQRFLRQVHVILKDGRHLLELSANQLNLQHPKHKMSEKRQSLDLLEANILRLQTTLIEQKKNELNSLANTLQSNTPTHRIKEITNQLQIAFQKLKIEANNKLQKNQKKFIEMAAKLDTLSPLATLKRGYAIATKDQQVLHKSSEVNAGDLINLTLLEGNLNCIVKESINT